MGGLVCGLLRSTKTAFCFHRVCMRRIFLWGGLVVWGFRSRGGGMLMTRFLFCIGRVNFL